MNENMKKIVELSDCEWIQDRWKVKEGDLYFFRINKKVFVIHGKPDMNKDCCIWLPVGFNPESGNWQIDDLLFGILSISGLGDLAHYFEIWYQEKYIIDEVSGNEGDLILKLMWLRKLIEEEIK